MNEVAVTEARRLRASGATYTEIGEALGVDQTTACRWCDEGVRERQREAARRWNSENRGRLSAAAIRRLKKQGGLRCDRCERPSLGRFCRECRRERKQVRLALVTRFWAEGLTAREIAERMGTTKAEVYNLVHRGRAEGFPLPYRNQRRPKESSDLGSSTEILRESPSQTPEHEGAKPNA